MFIDSAWELVEEKSEILAFVVLELVVYEDLFLFGVNLFLCNSCYCIL